MFATWLPPALESFFQQWQRARFKPTARTMTNLATQSLCWQSGSQAPTSFCYTAFLWSHLLCKIAVLFTRNCYQRRGQKNDHMPRAADLCFLYLHVSQNTALYRDSEKRPQQTSSRTESFVFRLHIKVGRTQILCKNKQLTNKCRMRIYRSNNATSFLLADAQSVYRATSITHWPFKVGTLNLTKYSQAQTHSRKLLETNKTNRNSDILRQSARAASQAARQALQPSATSES